MDTGETSYRRFLDGDDAAFAALVELYRPGLIRFVNSYVHDLHTAEDIAVDCFAYLLVHPRRYRFTAPLKTYIYVLGRSRAVDWLRRARRARTVPLEDAENEAYTGFTPEEAAAQKEKYAALNKALSALPEDMRRAVTLFYYEDMSYKEIASVLHKSPKQIDNLLARAKKLLRAELQQGGMEP